MSIAFVLKFLKNYVVFTLNKEIKEKIASNSFIF